MSATPYDCPACGAPGGDPVGRPANGFTVQAGEKTFRHPPYAIARCTECDCHFKTARLSDAELGHYYACLEYESFESDELMPPDRLIVEEADSLAPGSALLDFGCGVGRSTSRSARRLRCFGVEPNGRAAAVAAQHGITILPDEALNQGYAGSFDMIVLSDVYEHLAHPLEAVRRLARCLAPGGRLVAVTGAVDLVQPKDLLAEFWYFRAPGHLHMASARHMRWLAAAAGLEAVRIEFLSHYAPSLFRDYLQRFKLWAYTTTHLQPDSPASRAVRAIPVVRRAATWSNAPASASEKDHVFAVLRKTGSSIR